MSEMVEVGGSIKAYCISRCPTINKQQQAKQPFPPGHAFVYLYSYCQRYQSQPQPTCTQLNQQHTPTPTNVSSYALSTTAFFVTLFSSLYTNQMSQEPEEQLMRDYREVDATTRSFCEQFYAV